MNTIDNTQLSERIFRSSQLSFKVYTYGNSYEDTDEEYAVELFNSQGVFALTRHYKLTKPLPTFEVLLDYKRDHSVPVDLHHLNTMRNSILSAEFGAEQSDDEDECRQAFKNDIHLYAEEFEMYYTFFPELIDETRKEISRLLRSLRQLWMKDEVGYYIEKCKEIRKLIDTLLVGYTDSPITRFYTVLDLTRFNPNPLTVN